MHVTNMKEVGLRCTPKDSEMSVRKGLKNVKGTRLTVSKGLSGNKSYLILNLSYKITLS